MCVFLLRQDIAMTAILQMKTHNALHENDLPALAQHYLDRWLKAGTVVALQGDLGAGKTAWVRAFLRTAFAAPDMPVPSPTFTIVQEYVHPAIMIYHYDLYRLSHASELVELNFADTCAHGLVFIEWPQRAEKLLPPHWLVTITDGDSHATRNFLLEPPR
jgi:tRNA threonylcarbamoyladenosine biosynthesis protein TsaE